MQFSNVVILMNRIIPLLIPIVALAANRPTMRSGEAPPAANPAQYWSASVEAEANKKYDEALAAAQSFKQAGGDALLAWERLGWLSYRNGDYAPADKYYSEASRLFPTAINPLLGLLNSAQAQKDAKKIESTALALLRAEPTNYRAQMALAGLHLTTREYLRAVSEYGRVLVNYPDDLDATSGLAWALYYSGNKHQASPLFHRLLSVNPDYAYAQRGYELSTAK